MSNYITEYFEYNGPKVFTCDHTSLTFKDETGTDQPILYGCVELTQQFYNDLKSVLSKIDSSILPITFDDTRNAFTVLDKTFVLACVNIWSRRYSYETALTDITYSTCIIPALFMDGQQYVTGSYRNGYMTSQNIPSNDTNTNSGNVFYVSVGNNYSHYQYPTSSATINNSTSRNANWIYTTGKWGRNMQYLDSIGQRLIYRFNNYNLDGRANTATYFSYNTNYCSIIGQNEQASIRNQTDNTNHFRYKINVWYNENTLRITYGSYLDPYIYEFPLMFFSKGIDVLGVPHYYITGDCSMQHDSTDFLKAMAAENAAYRTFFINAMTNIHYLDEVTSKAYVKALTLRDCFNILQDVETYVERFLSKTDTEIWKLNLMDYMGLCYWDNVWSTRHTDEQPIQGNSYYEINGETYYCPGNYVRDTIAYYTPSTQPLFLIKI